MPELQKLSPSWVEDFFDVVNLDYPGLEAVKAAVARQDRDAAAAGFLAHMRQRSRPVYYRAWDNRKLQPDYDTTEADKVCRSHLVHVDLGEDIDWQLDPHGDPEWTYCLNRHQFLTELGRAYWYTADEKYTRAFKSLILDWMTKNPLPDIDWMLEIPSEQSRAHFMKQATWRPISAGIRLYTGWFPCYYHFLHSPEFTPQFHLQLLAGIVNHARYLRRYYTRHVSYFNVSPNWGLMESNGLAHAGILLPELKEAEDWRNTSLARLEEQVRMQVLADGVHVERCSGYHLVATFCLLQIAELARRNQLRVSQTWLDNVEKMVEFVLYLMKPHGVYPMLSDGDESDVMGDRASHGLWEDLNNLNMLEDGNDLRYVLKAAGRLFNRTDMLYVASRGREGCPPSRCAAAFPDGGFYISRTGWNPGDMYMAINCGLLGVYDQNCVHGHADALSVDVSAYGRTLVIDPGRYLYEGPYRLWFKGTSAHNTVAVDGLDQSELADEWMFKSWAAARTHCWVNGHYADYFDGSHDGYQRLADAVTHRRRILFVKSDYWLIVDDLTGAGKHDLELFYHLPPEAHVEPDSTAGYTSVQYPDGVALQIHALEPAGLARHVVMGAEDPIQGWVSYDYAVKQPAPTLSYRVQGDLPVRLVTLLLPCQGAAPSFHAVMLASDVWQVSLAGRTDLILFGDDAYTHWQDLAFQGRMLLAQFDEGARLRRCVAADARWIEYRGQRLHEARDTPTGSFTEINL